MDWTDDSLVTCAVAVVRHELGNYEALLIQISWQRLRIS